jgi:hypothetical protein
MAALIVLLESAFDHAVSFVLILGGASGAFMALTFLIAGRFETTQVEVLARIRRRQAARVGHPRDLTALGTADASTRRGWHEIGCRRRWGAAVLRVVVLAPLTLVAVHETWEWVGDVSRLAALILAGVAVVLGLGITAESIWKEGKDPILLIGRYDSSDHPLTKGAAATFVLFGRRRTVTVDVRLALRLRADGGLVGLAEPRGLRKFGAPRRVTRRLIEGEHCVLLCSGAEGVISQLGAISASELDRTEHLEVRDPSLTVVARDLNRKEPAMSPVDDVPVSSLPEREDWDDPTIVVEGGGGEVLAAVGGTALGAAAVEQARTQGGVKDDGKNCGIPHERYVEWIAGPSAPCAPWCAYFVAWAFDTSRAGNHDHKAPWGNSGYVPWIYDWAGRTGKLVSVPAHGDVFFFNPTDPSRSHMGLVAGADPAHHQIYTCEGNWEDKVLSQTRDYSAGDYRFARI